MKFEQKWTACGRPQAAQVFGDPFPAQVPGNVQWDYAKAHGMENFAFADGVKQFLDIEDYAWRYSAVLDFSCFEGEKVCLVAEGIDYEFDIYLDGRFLHNQEGMFTPVTLDVTDTAHPGSLLEIFIHTRPYRDGAVENSEGCRQAADQCCKPPVTYGWDWNPRLVTSGIWKPCYIETRKDDHIESCEAFYTLSEDLKTAHVQFQTVCKGDVTYTLYSPAGDIIYRGNDPACTVENVQLWWCNGQGNPALYRWEAKSGSCSRSGRIGFRTLRIVHNTDVYAPVGYPKTRDPAPITVELNGRHIFAKGSNFVNPELFFGCITDECYIPLIQLAKDANMNILRCWGGAGLQQDAFYDLCDENGILVWQEFMLACNNYVATPKYLQVLEQEAISIIKHLRHHACLAFWCGGNELFNRWSGMDDQSHALRLLNKLCYELDFQRPFLATAPLFGMAHGPYRFRNSAKQDVFTQFITSSGTAYSEFGVPATAPVEELKTIIPGNELFPPRDTPAWRSHFGFGVGNDNAYVCPDVLRDLFGGADSIEELVSQSDWLQCEGYKAIFEESRRQWPQCSMALNWCYNEPWVCAANCSILTYPGKPKPGYYAVRDALRPTLASARIPKFDWVGGENFTAELWYLNDSPTAVADTIRVTVLLGDEQFSMLTWETGTVEANSNKLGPAINLKLPRTAETNELKLVLTSQNGCGSTYTLLFRNGKRPVYTFGLNQ